MEIPSFFVVPGGPVGLVVFWPEGMLAILYQIMMGARCWEALVDHPLPVGLSDHLELRDQIIRDLPGLILNACEPKNDIYEEPLAELDLLLSIDLLIFGRELDH